MKSDSLNEQSDNLISIAERRVELEGYLENILDDLLERERKLLDLEKEMAFIEYQLSTFRLDSFLRSGKASRIIAGEQYRAKLQRDLMRKQRHRNMLRDEVIKSTEARDSLLKDLENLDKQEI